MLEAMEDATMPKRTITMNIVSFEPKRSHQMGFLNQRMHRGGLEFVARTIGESEGNHDAGLARYSTTPNAIGLWSHRPHAAQPISLPGSGVINNGRGQRS